MVISPLLVPADPGHGTSISGWVCSYLFSMLHLSLMCYPLYDVVIARARSSRMEGSQWLVVVLLIVFSFSLCFTDRAGGECSPPSFVTRLVLIPSDLAER